MIGGNRRWIQQHRTELASQYPNKVIIVSEGRVARILDAPIGVLEINRVAQEVCKGKDWSYTFLCSDEEAVL